MSEIRLNRLAAQSGTPGDADRLISIPAAAFTVDGVPYADRVAAAAAHPVQSWTFGTLRNYFREGISFVALTDTPSRESELAPFPPTKFLRANASGTALEWTDAPSGGTSETGTSIVGKLSALASGSRLSYNSLDDTPSIPAAQVQADWDVTDANSLAFIANKPTIPTLRTAAETAALLGTLTGDARLDISHIKGYAPGDSNVQPDWDETNTESHAFIRNKPTTITQAQIDKLAAIEAGATADQTAGEIVTALEALTGNARLDYSALDNVPDIPTGTSILRNLHSSNHLPTSSLTTSDEVLGFDLTDQRAGVITLQSIVDFVGSRLTIPSAEVDELQFAVATISQGLASNDAFAATYAEDSDTKDLQFEAAIQDDASLGFSHASGRFSFNDALADRDTNLVITGRIPIQHQGLPGRLRVYFREFLSSTPAIINRTVTVADHPIAESSTQQEFDVAIAGTQVRVRQGRNYKVAVEFAVEAGGAANAQLALIYTDSDNENLVAFHRFGLRLADMLDWPATAGTAGQLMAVASDGGYEFVDAPSAGSTETGGSIVTKLAALTGAARLSYTSLKDTPTIPAAQVPADWDAAEGAARILNKPTIPTLRTAAETVTLLSGLTGNARLPASAIRDLPEPQDGGLTSVHTDASLSGLGTNASPLAVAYPLPSAWGTAGQILATNAGATASEWIDAPTGITQAQSDKLRGIAAGAEVNRTPAEIVTALEALTGNARLEYSALRGTPTIPAAQVQADWNVTDTNSLAFIANKPSIPDAPTTASVTGLLRAFPPLTTLDNADTVFAFDASSSQGVEITLQSLASFVESGLTIPDAVTVEDENIPFAYALQSQGLTQNGALTNAAADQTVEEFVSFSSSGDDASLGFNHATGRFVFSNVHSDADTNLEANGRLAVTHTGRGGRLFIYLREYLTASPDTINRFWTLAEHPIAEATTQQNFHFPVTGTFVQARRGRTYRVVLAFTASSTGTASTGDIALRYTVEDDKNRISFRRVSAAEEGITTLVGLTDTPNAFTGQGGKFLAVNDGATAVEFVDAPAVGDGTYAGGNVEFSLGDNLLASVIDLPVQANGGSTYTGSAWVDLGVQLETGRVYQILIKTASDSVGSNDSWIVQWTGAQQEYQGPGGSRGEHVALRNNPTTNNAEAVMFLAGANSQNLVDGHIRGIHLFEGEVGDAAKVPFPETSSVPALTRADQRFFLTQPVNGLPEGYYQTYANPDPHRNRTNIIVESNTHSTGNQYGALLNPANPFGLIKQHGLVGGLTWTTESPRFVNIYLNEALVSSHSTLQIRFHSSEIGGTIGPFTFNRGTRTADFTINGITHDINGITYRAYAIANTEIDDETDALVEHLTSIQAGDKDIDVDVYTAWTSETNNTPLNYKDEWLIRPYFGQQHLAETLNVEDRDSRLILGDKALFDFNQLKQFDDKAAATAAGVLDRPGYRFDIGGITHKVTFPQAASDGTTGSVNRRNRIQAHLLQMANGQGFYAVLATTPSLKRDFDNAHAGDVDPNRRIGFISFYNADAQIAAYVQIGIDPNWFSGAGLHISISNRTSDHPASIDLNLSRLAGTQNFGGKAYAVYRGVLSGELQTREGILSNGWDFEDDDVILDFKTSVNGSDLNFNPVGVQFTAGMGYAPAHAAVASEIVAGLESIWPVGGDDAGPGLSSDPISSTSTTNRANSRILTKDVRLQKAIIVGGGNHNNGVFGGGGTGSAGSGYVYIPVESDLIVSSSAGEFIFLTGGRACYFNFLIIDATTGENPSISVSSFGGSTASTIRNVWAVN